MRDERYFEMLEQAVIDQIESDLRNEDHSALTELLVDVKTENLEAYLSDWRMEQLEEAWQKNNTKEVDTAQG